MRTNSSKILPIACWNSGGILNKTTELKQFLQDYSVKILLLQETFLTKNKSLSLSGYCIYRDDRPTNGGGTAIAIHKTIPHTRINIQGLKEIEATAIEVGFPAMNLNVTFISAYKKPKATMFAEDLAILQRLGEHIIMAGDFNAKSTFWGCITDNKAGGDLLQFINNSPSLIISPPPSPTHLVQNIPHDILDILIHSTSLPITSPQTLFELSSDHLPIYFTLQASHYVSHPTIIPSPTDWCKFRSRLSRKINQHLPLSTTHEIDAAISHLSQQTKYAFKIATPRQPPENSSPLPIKILSLIRQKRAAQKKFYRTRNQQDKRHFLHLRRTLQEELTVHRENCWKYFIEKANIQGTDDFWKITKLFSAKKNTGAVSSLQLPNSREKTYDSKLKTTIFANMLQDRFSPPPLPSPPPQIAMNTQEINYSCAEVSLEEVWSMVKHTNVKKAGGPDRITGGQIKNLPKTAARLLTKIFNSCIHLHYFPEKWKIAKVIMLPKPNKSHTDPANFRPISLLSQFSKIFERLILHRINLHLNAENTLNPDQFGFRPHFSSSLQALRLSLEVATTLSFRCSLPVVFLDLSYAFDKVHHQLLLYKLSTLLPPALYYIIQSFLKNRSFYIYLHNYLSTHRPIKAGVPQGSPLSPTLFSLFINDIPKFNDTKMYLYADDIALSVKRRQLTLAIDILQKAVLELEEWAFENGIGINPAKCQAIIFTWKKNYKPHLIKIGNTHLQWSTEAKYLGINFNNKLSWLNHVTQLREKMQRRYNAIKHLLKSPHLKTKSKIIIYNSIIRSIALYGTEVYATAPETILNTLQSLENRIIRTSVNPPPLTRNTTIREENNINPLRHLIYNTAINSINKAFEDPTKENPFSPFRQYLTRINPSKTKAIPTDIITYQLPIVK